MKINQIIGVSILAIMLIASSASKKESLDNLHLHEIPPNGVKVSENLFCDKTEVNNIGWKEYMYWTKSIFGSESPEFIGTIPDTLVWLKAGDCLEPNAELYFNHAAYNDYPVVGVSQKQAEQFSKWRSDRVFESTLIREKVIEYDKAQTPKNYFTIEKYFNGELENVISDKVVSFYPEFRLPTPEERIIILAYSDSLDKAYFDKCKSKYCSDCKENYPEIWSDIAPCDADSITAEPTRNVNVNCSSKKGKPIFNLRGNVGEWLSEADIAAGGGWKDNREEILNSDTIRYSEPNAWTGFRNVCEWRKWEE